MSGEEGKCVFCFLPFFLLFAFLQPHLQCMEVPRLGFESELQLPAYTTATAMPDLSRVCDLHHSSQQRKVHKPLRGVGVEIEIASSWILVRFVTDEPRWELGGDLFLLKFVCQTFVKHRLWSSL